MELIKGPKHPYTRREILPIAVDGLYNGQFLVAALILGAAVIRIATGFSISKESDFSSPPGSCSSC